jgi:hypothetical protein
MSRMCIIRAVPCAILDNLSRAVIDMYKVMKLYSIDRLPVLPLYVGTFITSKEVPSNQVYYDIAFQDSDVALG